MRCVDCDCGWVASIPANEKLAGDVYMGPEPRGVAGYVSPVFADRGENKGRLDWV